VAKYALAAIDLPRLGLFEAALEGVSLAKQEQALAAACRVADGYFSERYVLPLVWYFLPLASRVASGQGAAVEVFEAESLSLCLDVIALAEDAELVVSIQESEDGLTGWTTIASFDEATEPVHLTRETDISQKFVRIIWELTGASAEFVVSWDGDDLKLAVCKIAAYELLSARGLDPSGRDENIIKRNDDAFKWLKDVRAGKTSPLWIDQTPAVEEQRSYVASRKNRGWL
jgi:phage gp36-like protein